MAYFMVAECGACGNAFTCNPNRVPSKNNIPFCRECVEAANIQRLARGMKAIPTEGAYDVVPEATDSDWCGEYDDGGIDGAM